MRPLDSATLPKAKANFQEVGWLAQCCLHLLVEALQDFQSKIEKRLRVVHGRKDAAANLWPELATSKCCRTPEQVLTKPAS
jgi:hypothetical protein